jgi:hypothetical protein
VIRATAKCGQIDVDDRFMERLGPCPVDERDVLDAER